MSDLITIEHAGAKLSVSRDALFQAWMEKHFAVPMITGTLQGIHASFPPPIPNIGERYAGSILLPNRTGIQIFRMPLEKGRKGKWQTAMDHAAANGGELPDRVESALLHATQEEGEFESEWYWTREQRAGIDDYAWMQLFGDGFQDYYHKDNQFRVVLVRRVQFTY